MNPLDLTSEWDFSGARFELDDDLVAVGADLEPGTLVAAYAQGVFPMGLGDGGAPPMGWWSPTQRGVLRRGDLHVSRSLRRSARRFDVTCDVAFDEVVAGCADPSREGAWITDEVAAAYRRLHELGVARSLEVWLEGRLVGGLYGVAIGGLFAGESKFHRATDASKVALWALSDIVYSDDATEPRLIDVQWRTEHLAGLGVSTMTRSAYRSLLPGLVSATPLQGFHRTGPVLLDASRGAIGTPTPVTARV